MTPTASLQPRAERLALNTHCDSKAQPCVRLSLPQGDTALVSLFGAQLLSGRCANGQARLCFSPLALPGDVSASCGSVPICFLQLNQRAVAGRALPQYGVARTQLRAPLDMAQTPSVAQARLQLHGSSQARTLWPFEFEATATVQLAPSQLRIGFGARNTGTAAWPFALALHTYLQFDELAQTRRDGLAGLSVWDALDCSLAPQRQSDGSMTFTAETDRVYCDATTPLTLAHCGSTVVLSPSANLPEAVLWSPVQVRCAALPDMPADDWQHLLCVEAACIHTPAVLAAGRTWAAWQQVNAGLSNDPARPA